MFKLGKVLFSENGSLMRQLKWHRLQNGLTHRKCSSSYEGDGKTTAKVLNNDPEMGLMVNSFSEVRFSEIET